MRVRLGAHSHAEPILRFAQDDRPRNDDGTALVDGPVGIPSDGGAGNRTLVRVSIQNRVYVRRLVFLPSPRVGAEPTSPRPIS